MCKKSEEMDGDAPTKKLGLIVNPIAGMGGRVGLKGTDGEQVLREAIRLGARPRASQRAVEALQELQPIQHKLEVLTCSGKMGEEAARRAGFQPRVVVSVPAEKTTAEHTRQAAAVLAEKGVEILLFAGGDGTARDIYQAVGEDVPVVGIPAGVKIHSAVFAVNPRRAGELALSFLNGRSSRLMEAEVMDLNEEDYRRGIVSAQLYGYLRIPFERRMVQGRKAATPESERHAQQAIAAAVVDRMKPGEVYIVGPGTTTREILSRLNLQGSLLGVDLVKDFRLIGRDVKEQDILQEIAGSSSRLILTPVGGQGYLIGRGNLQISPQVIRQVGRDNILIVATEEKLNRLNGQPLLVDSGDRQLDEELCGFYRIITGYRKEVVYEVTC